MADLCKICSSILAQPDQSRNSLCTMTLSMVCMLMQLADNMDWFVNNGIIFQLSVLFTRECTVAMCRFFLVILNQIVSNGKSSFLHSPLEAYHPELLRSIARLYLKQPRMKITTESWNFVFSIYSVYS